MTALTAMPLTGPEQSTLNDALSIALKAKRDGLTRILDFKTWADGVGRREHQPELTAAAYVRDLQLAIKEVEAVQMMMENAKKSRVLLKADA